MLILKELRFRNIGRFVEEQIIDFDKLGMLIQVDGKNNNTGGSSGAAKSTIFNALDFLFGINSLPNSVLQSRLTEESIFVQGTFDYDGIPLVISRGKKLKIELNGEATTGSSKITEEKLDEIIAIPRNLFRLMLHKRQRDCGFFLNFTPREINEFLTDCLGLSRFKNYIDKLETQESDLSQMIGASGIKLEAAKAAQGFGKGAKTAFGPAPTLSVDKDTILKLKTKFDSSNDALKIALDTQKVELDKLELTRPSVVSNPFDSSVLKKLEQEWKEIKEKADQALSKERDRQTIASNEFHKSQTRIVEIDRKIDKMEHAKKMAQDWAEEIKKIRKNICPTCEQTWANESAKKKEESLIEQIKKVHPIILEGEKAKESERPAEQAIFDQWNKERTARVPEGQPEFANRLNSITKDIIVEKEKQENHQKEQDSINEKIQKEFEKKRKDFLTLASCNVTQLQGQVELDRRILDNAVNEYKSFMVAKEKYDAAMKVFEEKEKQLVIEIETLTKEVESLTGQLTLIQELKKTVKSYLSCSFDEALEFISDAATKRVRNVPTMASATIQLSGIRETKEGKVKEEVNALLHMDGDENIDIRSLCGGERSSIDLAIDLSVIELIEQKTNKGINVFILDEPFTGLDTVCIEMALEVLKNSNINKKLVIVDHNPEVKQMVESKVLVIRDGLQSKVIQD